MAETNLLELIPELDERYLQEGIEYRVLGGAATAAMTNAVIMDSEHRVISTNGVKLPTVRDNGTLRDLDVLIMSADRNVLRDAGRLALEQAKGNYMPAIFGFGSYEDYVGSKARHLSEWTSSRLTDQAGRMFYGLYPFIAETSDDSYGPWEVRSAAGSWNTIAPPAQAIAYEIRSIGGIRERDKPKVQAIREATEQFFDPDEYSRESLEGWLNFRTMLDFGRHCRIGSKLGNPFIEGVEYTPPQLAVFNARSKLMKALEEQEWALKIGQGSGRLGKILEPLRKNLIDEV